MSTAGVKKAIRLAIQNNNLSQDEAQEIVDKAVLSQAGNPTPITEGEIEAIQGLYRRILGPTTFEAQVLQSTYTAVKVLEQFLKDNASIPESTITPEAFFGLDGDIGAVTMAIPEDGDVGVTEMFPEDGDVGVTEMFPEDGDIGAVTMAIPEEGDPSVGVTSSAVGEEDGHALDARWEGVVSSLSMQLAAGGNIDFQPIEDVFPDGESMVQIGSYNPAPGAADSHGYSIFVSGGPVVADGSTLGPGDIAPPSVQYFYIVAQNNPLAGIPPQAARIDNPNFIVPDPAIMPEPGPIMPVPTFQDVKDNARRVFNELSAEEGRFDAYVNVMPSRGGTSLSSVIQEVGDSGQIEFEVFAATNEPVALPLDRLSPEDILTYYVVQYKDPPEGPLATAVAPSAFVTFPTFTREEMDALALSAAESTWSISGWNLGEGRELAEIVMLGFDVDEVGSFEHQFAGNCTLFSISRGEESRYVIQASEGETYQNSTVMSLEELQQNFALESFVPRGG